MMILAVPLLLGMLIARFAPTLSAKLQKPLSALAGIGLIVIIIGACLQYLPIFFQLGLAIFALVITHNGLAFLMGFMAGILTKADTASRRALTFEVGIQNSGLGIVILLTQLGGLGGAGVVAGLWATNISPAIICQVPHNPCLLYTSPSPRDGLLSRMPSSA